MHCELFFNSFQVECRLVPRSLCFASSFLLATSFSAPLATSFSAPLGLSCTSLPRAMRGRSSLVPVLFHPTEVRLPSNPSRSYFSQTSLGDETRQHIVKYVDIYRAGTSECVCQAKEGEGRKEGEKKRGSKMRKRWLLYISICLEIRSPSSLTSITAVTSQPFFLSTHLLTPPAAFNPVSKQLYEES